MKEHETTRGGRRLSYLRVSYVYDNFTEHALVGVHDGHVDAVTMKHFADLFVEHTEARSTPDLVYRGERPLPEVTALANTYHIRMRSFDGYLRALWNHVGYLEAQTERLIRDGAYPLQHHVDKRWAPLGEQPAESTAARQILDWLDTDGPRFVLVLGDFGTGKTFLVRVLAQELAGHDDLVPVLVTMRDLEKGRTLDELLAQHFARHRPEDSFHPRSFRYLLREGRIVLLFDGFDELAQRPTYDRVKQHFDTLRQAADGSAKIVVTSRHQHFATDSDVLNELGRGVRGMPGARVVRLFPLDEGQRRDLVEQTFDGADAEAFLRDLNSVPNLPELAANPRMLTFMIARRGSLAQLAGAGPDAEPITAGRLYETLLTDWLEHEVARQTAPGAAAPLSVPQRRAALRDLAVLLWRTGRASVPLAELGEFAEGIADLAAWQVQTGEATHAVGSGTVLVRTADNEFAFIHQSVLEWFVADTARIVLAGSDPRAVDQLLADHALTPLMADFLCDLAGTQLPVDWGRNMVERVDEPGLKAKANAALLLQRTDTRLPVRHADGRVVSANYAGQDLRGQDLSRQDLSDADLSGAELDGAVLPRALARASLRGARLVGARLDRANLMGADLSSADLRGARLMGANLSGAKLGGANLDRAVLLGATIEASALAAASTFGAALPHATPTAQFGGRSPVEAITSFGNGELLASGHNDGTVRLWDVGTGLQVRTLEARTRGVRALAVDPNGAWLASAGGDGTVRIWDPVTGAHLRTLQGHTRGALALVVGPDGAWLASTGSDGTVRIWDPVTGAHLRTLQGRTSGVGALTVSPDGAWLASTGGDGTVRIWDPVTGVHLRTLDGRTRAVGALAVDPNGAWLASAGSDGTLRIWDPSTGAQLHTLQDHTDWVRALAVDPNGAWLASAGGDGTLRIWDPSTGTQLRTLQGRTDWVGALAVDPNGAWLASAGGDRTVRIWDPATGTQMRTLHDRTDWVRALAVDPNGAWLASAGGDRTVRIWDPATGTQLRTLQSRTHGVAALAAGPDGAWLASAGGDGTVRIWDPSTGTQLRTLQGRTDSVGALAVDPNGAWLASAGGDGTVRIWHPATGTQLRSLEGHSRGVGALAVDPNGAWLASAGGDGTVRIWDPAAGVHLRALRGHSRGVGALVVGPDGAWLASAGGDRTVRIWDPAAGVQLRTMQGHTGRVGALAVDPKGAWLASAGDDGSVRIWDPATGAQSACLVGDENGWAALLPDGGYRMVGAPAGMWWAAGLCRFEPGETDDIAQHVPGLHPLGEDGPRDVVGG